MVKENTCTLIHDDGCERIVLGTLLSSSMEIADVREHLCEDCFYDPKHQEIYTAIKTVDRNGDTVNLITVNAALSRMGAATQPAELVDIMQSFATGSLIGYALRLKELDMRRKLWELGQTLIQGGSSEVEDVDIIQESARKRLSEIFASTTADVHTLTEAAYDLRTQIQRNKQHTGEIYGTPTGFREIDRRGGLAPTDLVVVAGETSMGKTSFATALAINAICAGHPVAFYSMEMSNIQLAARIAAMRSGINARSILQDALPDDKAYAVEEAMTRIPTDLCYFDDDATSSFDKIAASIRTLALRHGIKGAVVDYIQILNVNMRSTNKEQAMADVSRRLKNLAKELGIWIIVLSQLNRDRDRPWPTLDRLRDSGQIGEAADTIALIARPSVKSSNLRYPEPFDTYSTQGTALIDVAKGRNTGIYRFVCGFNSETTCFYDVDELSIPRIGHNGIRYTSAGSDQDDDDDFNADLTREQPLPF